MLTRISPSLRLLWSFLLAYRALAAGLDPTRDISEWWRQRKIDLPNWSALAFKVALFQPSSAGVERIFSMLDHLFTDEQTAALADYRTAAIMVRYNDLQRKRLEDARRAALAAAAVVMPVLVPASEDSD